MKTCPIVDDSGIIRKVARRILESLKFQILEAENGEQAFETCQRELPDAILLDWNMPKMDGYDFLRALRCLPGGERPKVIFCTTENDVAHIARALQAGANEASRGRETSGSCTRTDSRKQKPRPRAGVRNTKDEIRLGFLLLRLMAPAARSRGPTPSRCNSCHSRRWRAFSGACR